MTPKIDDTFQPFLVMHRFREPLIRAAVQALRLSPGSQGLDAGCGHGFQAALLAEAIGPAGHVTGLDLSPEILQNASTFVENSGLAEQVSFQDGNVIALPFEDKNFDWVWSMDCVGYLPHDQLPMLRELARVVRPGGLVAILAWSSEKLLPGHPLLEARLQATSLGLAPFKIGMKAQEHFHRALGWFREAGLEHCFAHTFTHDVVSPLSDDNRLALELLFQMRWPGVESELSQEDSAEFHRLCLPESADFILNEPDYYAFFTYSMFHGRVPQ